MWSLVLTGATVPAVVVWWRGRALRAFIADPLFAERLWTYRQQAATIATCGATLVTTAAMVQSAALAAAALTTAVLTISVATHRVRRLLVAEPWSFWTFFLFRTRLTLAACSFWFVPIASPLIVVNAGAAMWPIAAALLAVLLLVNRHFPQVFCVVAGATRVDDPALHATLEQLIAKTSLPMPRLYQLGRTDGIAANAFALPSLAESRVVFLAPLLARLTPRETAAILAHELAHLEQFDKRRLTHLARVVQPLVLLGTVGAALTATLPWALPVGMLVWGLLVFGVFVYSALGAKQRETDGDARAAELTGDPEALIAALTQLHVLGHVPRRWDPVTEEHATHPALARRVAALRRHTQVAPALGELPALIPTVEEGGYLLFESGRLRHVSGVPEGTPPSPHDIIQQAATLTTYSYDALASAHLQATPRGASLVLTDRQGAPTRINVASDQVDRVHALLDIVERDITPLAGLGNARLIRLLASLSGVLTLLTGHWLILAPQTIIAALRPSRASSAAFAAGAVITAIVATTDQAGTFSYLLPVVPVAAVVLAWQRHRLPVCENSGARVALPILFVWSVAATLLIGVRGIDPVRVAVSAADTPAALVGFAAMAAWLWSESRERPGRRLAALVSLGGAIALALASTMWFADRFSSDRLLSTRSGQPGRRLHMLELTLTPAATFGTEHEVATLLVSPDASAFAFLESCDHSEDACGVRTLTVVSHDRVSRSLEVADATFLDDRTLIVVDESGSATHIRTEAVDGGTSAWAVAVPTVHDSSLLANGNGEWAVMARDADGPVRVEGRVGQADARFIRFGVDEDDEDWVEWRSYGTGSIVSTQLDLDFSPAVTLAGLFPWFSAFRTQLVTSDQHGQRTVIPSELEAVCSNSGPGMRGVACLASEGRRTHVWLAGAGGQLTNVGWTEGERTLRGASGARVLTSGRCGWSIIDVAKSTESPLSLPAGGCVYTAAISENALATATYDDGTTTIATYRITNGR